MLTGQEVRFDGWTLRRRTGELARDGRKIRLQSQPLQILEALLARPGDLVTREELIARLWPQGVVDFDTALNSAVHRLRAALDDRAETPRYIETIPRRGYRFVGTLATDDMTAAVSAAVAPASATGRRAWMPVATAFAAAVTAAGFLWVDRDGPRTVDASASAQAQERFLRAQHFLQRRDGGDLARARGYFEEALSLDADFARAWSGLASAYWLQTAQGQLPETEGLGKVRESGERALALDSSLAEAHVRLANYWNVAGDRQAAEEHLRKALALEPDSALVLVTYASIAASEGRFTEAADLQQRAVLLEPLSTATRYNLACYLYYAGRTHEAEQELIRLRELHPSRQAAPELHGVLLVTTGRPGEAIALAAEWEEGPDRHYVNALALDALGRRPEADAALARLVESGGVGESFRIAEIYAQRGDLDHAFHWLRTGATHAQSPNWRGFGRRPLWLMEHSALMDPLRQDPRWTGWHELASRPVRQASVRRGS